MLLRPYTAQDAEATLEVFRRAVRLTAIHDYTLEQIAAWSNNDMELAAWHARRAARPTLVADIDGVVGFSDVDDSGYIDMLFVDPDFARRGVASTLLALLTEQAATAGALELTVHASITARPFFESHGFEVVEERRPVLRGVELTNFAMRRRLH
ncbi:MAG: family N-acetyltransferase [Frondihabitans sp.]|nr:family N-acetyltransferase [Frondihabitans sp.]